MTTTLAPNSTSTFDARPEPNGERHTGLLLDADAGGFLSAAVAVAGGEIVSWRPRQIQSSRRGATASYQAKVRWADGRVRDETFAASAGHLPARTVVFGSGDDRVAVWRFPDDPDLPGLALANNEIAVAALLADLGLGSGPVRLTQRAYRPRNRAVTEAVGRSGRVFIKAVRPDRVEQLHHRHRLLVANGVPAPQSLGWTSDGLLVLQALPGRTLRDTLRTRATPLPKGEEIIAQLDRLPGDLTTGTRRRSWLDKVNHYATTVSAILPAESARVAALADAITSEAGTGPITAVHGDFYESQLLIDSRGVCGLLDIDTAGGGDRLDDLGCLIGHLSVLAQLEPRRAAAINRVGARYVAVFDRTVDPADLRYRAAAVAVSLATGPYRVQQPCWPTATRGLLAVAERWLASARRART